MRKNLSRRDLLGLLTAGACVPLSGCILTQWTDRYFLGTVGGPPVYSHRVATGLFLLPFALAIDAATVPIQFLLLVIMGDRAVYSSRGPASETSTEMPAARDQPATSVPSRERTTSSLTPAQRERMWACLLERLESTATRTERQGDVLAFGVTADGSLVDVELSREQVNRLLATVGPEHALVMPSRWVASAARFRLR